METLIIDRNHEKVKKEYGVWKFEGNLAFNGNISIKLSGRIEINGYIQSDGDIRSNGGIWSNEDIRSNGGIWSGGDIWSNGSIHGVIKKAHGIETKFFVRLNLPYVVQIQSTHIKIGCELHPIEYWEKLTEMGAKKMDGEDAVKFKREHLPHILAYHKILTKQYEKDVG